MRKYRTLILCLLLAAITFCLRLSVESWIGKIIPSNLSSEGYSLKYKFAMETLSERSVPESFYRNTATNLINHSLELTTLLWILLGCLSSKIKIAWKSYWNTVVVPEQLAIFRFISFSALVVLLYVQRIPDFGDIPSQLRIWPPLWGFIQNFNLPNTTLFEQLVTLAMAFSGFAALGIWGRFCGTMGVFLSLFLLLIPQSIGKIDHYHHVWLFCLLCIVSPSWDAYTLLGRKRNQSKDVSASNKYFLPIGFAGFLVGLAYFFSGLWKYLYDGIFWVDLDNQNLLMANQWGILGHIPKSMSHFSSQFVQIGAVYTLGMELLFLPLLILVPSFRRWALLLVLPFHFAVYLMYEINFWHLPLCVLAIYPWFGTWNSKASYNENIVGPSVLLKLVGTTILTAMLLSGLTYFDSWPIGTYPSFAGSWVGRIHELSIKVKRHDRTVLSTRAFSDHLPSAINLGCSRWLGLVRQIGWQSDEHLRAQKTRALEYWIHKRLYPNDKLGDFKIEVAPVVIQTFPLDSFGIVRRRLK